MSPRRSEQNPDSPASKRRKEEDDEDEDDDDIQQSDSRYIWKLKADKL